MVQGKITGLKNFRDKLIIFTTSKIYQINGSSSADFALTEIVGELGCAEPDSIQEVAGDLLLSKTPSMSSEQSTLAYAQ